MNSPNHQDSPKSKEDALQKSIIDIISNPLSARSSPRDQNPQQFRELNSADFTEFQDDGDDGILETLMSCTFQTRANSIDDLKACSTELYADSRVISTGGSSSSYSLNNTADSNLVNGNIIHRPYEAKSAPHVSTNGVSDIKLIKSAGTLGIQNVFLVERSKQSDSPCPMSSKPTGTISIKALMADMDGEIKDGNDELQQSTFKDSRSPGTQDYDSFFNKTPVSYIKMNEQQSWERTMPALLNSTSFNAHKYDASVCDHQKTKKVQIIQDTIKGTDSFTRSQTNIELIKGGLARSKSVQSKKLTNANNSSPVLFSQTKSLKRTNSTTNGSSSFQVELNDGVVLTDNYSYQTEINGLNVLESGDSLLREVIPEESHYNPVTNESELNCLKPPDASKVEVPLRKGNFFLNAFSPPFKNFYKAEDPKLSKSSELNFWTTQSGGDMTGLLKKNERFQYIIIWVLFVLLMASLCTFIPFIIIYSRGTESTVKSYLTNIKPEHRNELLKEFISRESLDPLSLSVNKVFGNQAESAISIVPDLSASIAGITEVSQLPEKYRNNLELMSVMNNTDLQNVFYGIDYAPRNVIYPMCGVTLHDVILDIALLSQVTSRVRTYGTQCNQAKFILESIKALNLNVSLALGVWIGRDEAINAQQMLEMKSLLRDYPRQYFESVYIGNEVMFREEQTPEGLARYINEAKSFVVNELKWNLPVGTSELGSKASIEIMEASDIFGSNTHPFFNGDYVENSTQWVYDFVNTHVEPIRQEAMRKKAGRNIDLVISEVGWPYQGGNFNHAMAGKVQMQYFLSNWICESKKKNFPWFYFEAFDEPWKSVYHRENAKWETEWGIFTADRRLKSDIVFPKC